MRALVAIARSAFVDALARPASLISQMAIMFVNDLAWIVFWVLFFGRVDSLNGWTVDDVVLLQAVLTTGGGVSLGLLANARRIAAMAVDGELDSILAMPVNPLAHLLLKRVLPVNLGDLVFGVTLFAVAGDPTLKRTAIFVVVSLLGSVVITGFLVLIGSTAFFVRRSEAGELGFHALLLLGSYPIDIFKGTSKVLMFTVIPAAFVATVPARLVADFDVARALWLIGAAAIFATAGSVAFTAGLRRYTSGAVWTKG